MSSFEINKIIGAILLGGLVAMATGVIADFLVRPRHAAEVAAVPTGEAAPAEAATAATAEPAIAAETAAAPDAGLASLLTGVDAAAGEKLAKRCATCHTFNKGGAAKVGPNLWDIVGARHARMEGFKYSEAIAGMADKAWDYAALDSFLASPKTYAPGTKMAFAGLKKAEERAAVILWLRGLSDSPRPLP